MKQLILIICFLLLRFTAVGDCWARHAPNEISVIYSGVSRSNYHPNDVMPAPENGRVFTLIKHGDYYSYQDSNCGWHVVWTQHEGSLPTWKAYAQRYVESKGCYIIYYVKVDGNDCDTKFIGNDLDTLDWSPKPYFHGGTMSIFHKSQIIGNGASLGDFENLIIKVEELFKAYDLDGNSWLDSFDYTAWLEACAEFWVIYYRTLDINEDGKYNFIDYAAWARANSRPYAGLAIIEIINKWLKYNKDKIDVTGDGWIDFKDWSKISDTNNVNFPLLLTLSELWLDYI